MSDDTIINKLSQELSTTGDFARVTKLPGIIPPNANLESLHRAVKSIKVILDTREGGGSVLDKSLTLRDLLSAGALELSVGSRSFGAVGNGFSFPSSGTPAPVGYVDPRPVLSTPPVLTDLLVTGAFSSVFLGWSMVEYQNHRYAEVYRASTNSRGLSSLIGTTTTNFFNDLSAPLGQQYFYWVRAVGITAAGVTIFGPDNAVNGVGGGRLFVGGTDFGPLLIQAADLANGSITGTKIANDAVTALKIAAGQVTAAKTAIAAIDPSTGNLTANSVTAVQIVAGQVTAGKLATDSVVAANIQAGQIVAGKIAANAVVASNIVAGTITGDRLLAGTITGSLIQGGTITGTNIAAGTITAGNIDATTMSANNVLTRGLTVRDASGNVILSSGIPLAAANASLALRNDQITIGGLGYTGALNATAGATFGTNISGQITAANASTFIADLAVNTLQIAGNAVTVIISGTTSAIPGTTTPAFSRSTVVNIASIVTSSTGQGRVSLLMTASTVSTNLAWQNYGYVLAVGAVLAAENFNFTTVGNYNLVFKILRNGTIIKQFSYYFPSYVDNANITRFLSTVLVTDNPGPGVTCNYTLEVYTSSSRLVSHIHEIMGIDYLLTESKK